ncbi:DUF354 domain-containing protein [Oceanotoga sp. DSM 15011]|uniref:DUF354 domain-containing protein n=1 Tax=Oceanotoga sp. DSM 15011 TaxID=2984951 RepID=UPI00298F7BE1|nr:DUF354 domain-containing protein [Oceanotoga sp. DSM 15011]
MRTFKSKLLYRKKHNKSIILELIKKILLKYDDVNLIIHPRYNSFESVEQFDKNRVKVIENEAVDSTSIAAFSDLFIGGGGTINIEAAYYGTPVISLKPVITLYEDYMLKNELTHRPKDLNNIEEILSIVEKNLNNRYDKKNISKLWIETKKDAINSFYEKMRLIID